MGYGYPPPPCGQTDRHVSKHYLPVVLRTRAVMKIRNGGGSCAHFLRHRWRNLDVHVKCEPAFNALYFRRVIFWVAAHLKLDQVIYDRLTAVTRCINQTG